MVTANSGRVWLALIGWLIVGTLAIWATSVLLILYTGARPVIRKADAIMVLGAAQYNGRPSPVLQARLDHGIDLYKKGFAKTMVFTGGVGAVHPRCSPDLIVSNPRSRRHARHHPPRRAHARNRQEGQAAFHSFGHELAQRQARQAQPTHQARRSRSTGQGVTPLLECGDLSPLLDFWQQW